MISGSVDESRDLSIATHAAPEKPHSPTSDGKSNRYDQQFLSQNAL